MLVVPTLENLQWRNFPYVTTALIIINCLVYFVVQSGDDKRLGDAYEMSVNSGLFTIEAQAYQNYQKQYEVKEKIPNILPEDVETQVNVWLILDSDVNFQNQLSGGILISTEDEKFHEWSQLREQYDGMVDRVIDITYAFTPAWPSWLTAFTSMFLHGNINHLLGNMIFLFLAGAMLESAIGSPFFLFAYLTVGMAESWMTVPFMTDSAVQSLGASGAITGIMGTYSVIMGMTRIPVFYSFGFYFANGYVPAFVLIFFWTGKEFYYYLFGQPSSTHYLAHIAGFIAGGAIGLAFRMFKGGVGEELFTDVVEEKNNKSAIALEKGLNYLSKFKFQEARKYVSQALRYDPKSQEILTHLFNIDKQHPESNTFQQTAVDLLTMLADNPDNCGKLLRVVRECNKRCPTLNIPTNLMVRIIIRFAGAGEVRDAMHLLNKVMNVSSNHEQIPNCLLLCGRSCLKKSLIPEGQKCFNLLHSKYPDCHETRTAKQLLASVTLDQS